MNDPNENKRGYKSTNAGWIPSEWDAMPIEQVAEVRFSGVDKKTASGEQHVKLCNYTDVYYNDRIHPDMEFMSASATPTEIERFQLRKGDVVLTKDSEAADDIAKPALVEVDLPGVLCGYHLALLRPRNGAISGRYLSYALRRDHARSDFARFANGVTRFGLTADSFSKVHVPVPPHWEQEKIGAILSTCDHEIWLTNSLIASKEHQEEALMQLLLSGRKRLPGFIREWRPRRLSTVLKHTFRPVEWAGDRVFNLVSVRRRSLGLFRRNPLRGDQYKTKDLHELKSGDFLVSKRQVTHGALAMVTDEFDGCHVSKEYSIFTNRDPKKLHMPFFDWMSRTRRLWWLAYVASNGVVIEKLIFVPQDFLKFEVPFPPSIEEQMAIVEVLDASRLEIDALKSKLKAINKQKASLMQKLLNGNVRVKA